jgi:hypothetical protein
VGYLVGFDSPNQDGVEGTDSEEVYMITDPSAILVIYDFLREFVMFFLSKRHIFILARYKLATRCACRGIYKFFFPVLLSTRKFEEELNIRSSRPG